MNLTWNGGAVIQSGGGEVSRSCSGTIFDGSPTLVLNHAEVLVCRQADSNEDFSANE
jgi:hypothetical protein